MWLFTLLALLLTVHAAEPMEAWRATSERGVPASYQAWHPQYEDNGDYGESWFFATLGDDGSSVFALLSVTNLGLRTFDGSIDVQVYSPDGGVHDYHREVHRDAIHGSAERMDITIGGAHAWGGGSAYHLTVQDAGIDLRLDLANELPSYRFGDGLLRFGADGSREYALAFNTPQGRVSGQVTVDGARLVLSGRGYADHGWTTIKLPDFLRGWQSLRLFGDRYSLVLHRHLLTDTYGGGDNRFGVLGVDGRIVGGTRRFTMSGSAPRKVDGNLMPTRFQVRVQTGGYKVEGTITEEQFQQSIDVLGKLSLPVRLAIKAFYANPWLMRYRAHYELDVTDKQGAVEHISGPCLIEVDSY